MDKLKVVLAGSVETQSGYGNHSRDIARALIKSDKYDVSIISLRWGSTPRTALDPDNPEDKIILDRIVDPRLSFTPDVFIHVTIPNEFQKAGKYNIGITAGIETTLCRAEWIDGCNKMDLVIATSNHSKKVFELSKFERRDTKSKKLLEIVSCTRPIEVLFEGIDYNVFNGEVDKDSEIFTTIDQIPEKFAFLFVGHWLQGQLGQDRKDVGMLIRVFLETFKRKKKTNMPALILKTSKAGFSEMERHDIIGKIQDLRKLARMDGWQGPLPNVYVLHGGLTDKEMNHLYRHPKVKAMVSFTKGEGFGRPLLEFTTTGKPVIASNWSGQTDFLNPKYSVLLGGQIANVDKTAMNDWIVEGSQWFTVNYDMAQRVLADVASNYKEYADRARPHAKYTRDNFSFDKMMEKLCLYIDNIEKYANTKIELPTAPVKTKLNLPKLQKVGDKSKKLTLPRLKKVDL